MTSLPEFGSRTSVTSDNHPFVNEYVSALRNRVSQGNLSMETARQYSRTVRNYLKFLSGSQEHFIFDGGNVESFVLNGQVSSSLASLKLSALNDFYIFASGEMNPAPDFNYAHLRKTVLEKVGWNYQVAPTTDEDISKISRGILGEAVSAEGATEQYPLMRDYFLLQLLHSSRLQVEQVARIDSSDLVVEDSQATLYLGELGSEIEFGVSFGPKDFEEYLFLREDFLSRFDEGSDGLFLSYRGKKITPRSAGARLVAHAKKAGVQSFNRRGLRIRSLEGVLSEES